MARPNILLLMADQLAAPALPFYGHTVVRTPALSALAARSLVFDAAYCNFPICAPSRYSMLTGRLPHAISAFDNACELASEIPTMAHYLGAAGYRTILAGKMHFVGPDQLHGFDERLTTDIYPSEFLWVPDWSQGPANKPTGVGMGHVVDAGPCLRNMQIDYDEEVEHVAVQKLYDLARHGGGQPFFLTASFTHPHPPFVAPQEHWDAYADSEIDLPSVPEIPYEQLDPHSQWLYLAHGQDRHTITREHVLRARRAYYAMASYVDEKIGRVLQALRRAGLEDDTLVVFCGDHGEMMGVRGMWFKQTFYEWSARVPLLVAGLGVAAPGRRAEVCSLVDLLPTFLDVAACASRRWSRWMAVRWRHCCEASRRRMKGRPCPNIRRRASARPRAWCAAAATSTSTRWACRRCCSIWRAIRRSCAIWRGSRRCGSSRPSCIDAHWPTGTRTMFTAASC